MLQKGTWGVQIVAPQRIVEGQQVVASWFQVRGRHSSDDFADCAHDSTEILAENQAVLTTLGENRKSHLQS